MPVVAPKVKVVRVIQQGLPSLSGAFKVIDLGVINCPDIFVAPGIIELQGINGEQFNVPGRVIEEVYLTPDNFVDMDGSWDVHITTPNTQIAAPGFTLIDMVVAGGTTLDTTGQFIQGNAPQVPFDNSAGNSMRFRDCGPLYLAAHQRAAWFGNIRTWQANTPYAFHETIIESGKEWDIITNGVSGNVKPDFSGGGPVVDGTIVWETQGDIPTTGSFHPHVVVSDQPGTVIPRPTSLQFVQQPTNVVSGVAIDPPPSVMVLDQNGDPYQMLDAGGTVGIFGAGTLNGTKDRLLDGATGIVTFTNISITEPANGYVLRVYVTNGVNIPPVDSDPFNVT